MSIPIFNDWILDANRKIATLSKRLFIALLLILSFSAHAADLFPDTSCYSTCPATPSGKLPMDFFNIPVFQQAENCHALEGFCQWVKMTSPLELKPIIVSDYDGTQTAEQVSVHADEPYISSRARPENSIAFGVIAPKLTSLGYDIGMQTGGISNIAAAHYIAAREDSCSEENLGSRQARYDYCISQRMVGMTAQQVRALYGVMYRVFPALNTYFSVTQAMLNYLVAMGYPVWTQTGGTPYPALQKSKMYPQLFNKTLNSRECDITKQSSEAMNKVCPIIYDASKISLGKVTLVMNTENVCEGVSYAEAETTGKAQLCIDDGEGKVSGLHSIETRAKNAILNFNGNSSGDVYPGLYVAQQGGIVFIHNNPSVCEAINQKVPASCFNIVDPESERIKTVNSPTDEVYAMAAEQAGLKSIRREKKHAAT